MIQSIAILSVHASPLAPMGGKKTGGMNVYIRKLAEEMGRRGIQVDIYTRRTSIEQPDVDHSIGENVRVIHITAGGVQVLSPDDIYPHLSQFTAGIIAFCTRQSIRYDIVYSHYWLSGWVAHKLNEVWGTPFVHMFHTLGHMKNRIMPGQKVPMPDTRTGIETWITKWANRIVAATPAEHAQLLWLYRADRRKIVIASPGVDLSVFHPMSVDKARDQLEIPSEKQMLLFVGRLEPLKAVDTVLAALHRIAQARPELAENLIFKVIGGDLSDQDDPEMARLRALVPELNLTDTVEFVGAKDQTTLPFYYTASMAVVMPSDYESFGMVALEAMACGTPVIASEVGGLAYLVKDGETGFLIPSRDPVALADKIVTLLEHPEKQHRMRVASALLAYQYAWSEIADQLMVIFDEVLAEVRVNPHKS
ncbi:MAG: glycosyltransferase [Anaerolineae bacterium]|nr:glycosyltransferase [Anaerolineae bacterium]